MTSKPARPSNVAVAAPSAMLSPARVTLVTVTRVHGRGLRRGRQRDGVSRQRRAARQREARDRVVRDVRRERRVGRAVERDRTEVLLDRHRAATLNEAGRGYSRAHKAEPAVGRPAALLRDTAEVGDANEYSVPQSAATCRFAAHTLVGAREIGTIAVLIDGARTIAEVLLIELARRQRQRDEEGRRRGASPAHHHSNGVRRHGDLGARTLDVSGIDCEDDRGTRAPRRLQS